MLFTNPREVLNELVTFGTSALLNRDRGSFWINGDENDGTGHVVKLQGVQTATTGSCAANGVADVRVRLYNLTTAAYVGNEVSLWNEQYNVTGTIYVVRSADLGISQWTSGWNEYIPVVTASCISTVDIRALTLLDGIPDNMTKVSIEVDLGCAGARTANTYDEIFTSGFRSKRWRGYDSSIFNPTGFEVAYFYSTFKSGNAAHTASLLPHDISDLNDLCSAQTTASTSYVSPTPSSISFPSSSGNEIRLHGKSSNAAGTISVKAAKLVFVLDRPTSVRLQYLITTYAQNSITGTTYSPYLHFSRRIVNADHPAAALSNILYAMNCKAGASGQVYGNPSDYTTAISGLEASWSSTAITLVESGTISNPFDLTNNLSTVYKRVTSNGTVYSDYLQMDLAITYPVSRRIFVT